jgi:hypothetical protein
MSQLAEEINHDAVPVRVRDNRTGRSDSGGRGAGAGCYAGALRDGAVRTIVVVTVSPSLLVLGAAHRDRGGDVAFTVVGLLVLSAVGSLKSLQAHARHASDAKQEHQQTDVSI